MPQIIDVPGMGHVEFPDGMSDEQITSAIQKNLAPPDDTSIGQKALIGIGRGLTQAGQGIKQAGLEFGEWNGWTPPGTAANYTKKADTEKALYESTPAGKSTAGQVGEFIGGTLPYIAAPAGGMLARTAVGAGIGGLQYVPEGGDRAGNAALGAGINAVLPPVINAGIKGGAKIINAVRGNYANPAEKAIIELGKQHNVPVMAGDASTSSLVKGTQDVLDNMPWGLGATGHRQAQMQAAKAASENVTNKYQGIMDATPFGGKTGLRNLEEIASNQFDPRNAAAKNILQDIQNSGDDWQKIMRASGNLNLFRRKLIADAKYDKVAKMADELVDVKGVPLERSNTISAIDNAMSEIQRSPVPHDEKLLPLLQTIKDNISSKKLNFTDMRDARGRLGSLISEYYKGNNKLVGEDGARYLQAIRSAVTKDMDTFANMNNPELKGAWRSADRFYKTNVVPFKDKALASALKDANPDEIYGKFITQGAREGGRGTGRAQSFYNALDNKGKAAVKYGMVSEAFERAVKSDSEQFSPAQFAGYLDRYAASKGVLFKGADKAEIDGFKNLMRHVDRSYLTVNKPQTGVKNIPYLISDIASKNSTMAGLALGAPSLIIKPLFTTSAGKRLLLSASTLKQNSPAMQKATETFIKMMQQGAITQGVQPYREGQENVSQ